MSSLKILKILNFVKFDLKIELNRIINIFVYVHTDQIF